MLLHTRQSSMHMLLRTRQSSMHMLLHTRQSSMHMLLHTSHPCICSCIPDSHSCICSCIPDSHPCICSCIPDSHPCICSCIPDSHPHRITSTKCPIITVVYNIKFTLVVLFSWFTSVNVVPVITITTVISVATKCTIKIILWLMRTNIAVVTVVTFVPRSLWLLERAKSVAPCGRFLACYQQFYLVSPETFKGHLRVKVPCSVSPSHIMPDRNNTAPANVNKSDVY